MGFRILPVVLIFLFNILGCSPDGNGGDDPTPTPPTQVTAAPTPTGLPTPTVTPRESVAVLSVNGNGILFGGTITDGSGSSRTVEGVAPQEFVAAAQSGRSIVGSFFKKTAGRDFLEAKITYQGVELAKNVTNAEFGQVTVVATIP